MSFSTKLREELIGLKMWNNSMKQDEQLTKLYVREAFIKSGFINDPTKKYHLEMLFKEKEKAEEIKKILENFNINIKLTKKKADYMLYLKDADDISTFLALIGASNSFLEFEEIRVEKEARNNINRIVNCETANLNKTIQASSKQIEDIKLLKNKNKFTELPQKLQEIATIRLENPDCSYEELGQKLLKPISKSGVKHRLEKISEIASEYKK